MKGIPMAAAVWVALASGAQAEVTATTTQGFEVAQALTVKAPPSKLYKAITEPQRWWNSAHTFSGSAANLVLDPEAGGCFCEKLPQGGSVQHLAVVYAAPDKLLRLRGALGPLQGEAVEGTMTFALKPAAEGTTLAVSYIVGGYLRKGPQTWAPVVDEVLGDQLRRLKRYAETGSPEPVKP